jgi:predicted Zn finger-like uncharacterized protein
MKLATRCASCGTVFRVVQDQLLVSEGWVRCGRCREVFNAVENMFELKKDVPTASIASSDDDGTPATTPPANAGDPPSTATAKGVTPSDDDSFKLNLGGARKPRGAHAARDPWLGQPTDQVVRTSLWPPSEAPDAADPTSTAPASMAGEAGSAFAGVGGLGRPASTLGDSRLGPLSTMPDFMLGGPPTSWWDQPHVRSLLKAAAVVLTVMLLGQWAIQSRDALAASIPMLESPLQALCSPFGCKVDAPRKPLSLKVESVSFNETNAAGHYRVSVVVRNTHTTRVKMPNVDLRLANTRNDTLARRVLTPGELGVKEASIPAGQEVSMTALLRINHPNVSGYDVTLFYP